LSKLVEKMDDGSWLIIPTGEIRKCSRSTAYRHAKKSQEAINNLSEAPAASSSSDTLPTPESPPEDEIDVTFDSPEDDEITIEAPVFDLPSLEDMQKEDEGEDPSSFQEEGGDRDQDFLSAFKGARVIEDDEGNKKIRLEDFLIGDNAIIHAMLRTLDNSLYDFSENKHGIILWNKESRDLERRFYVKILGVVAPKTAIELDPTMVIIIMTGWLYGFPLIKLARHMRGSRRSINLLRSHEEGSREPASFHYSKTRA